MFDDNGEATLYIDVNDDIEEHRGYRKACSIFLLGKRENDDNQLWEGYQGIDFKIYNPTLTIVMEQCYDECRTEFIDGVIGQITGWQPYGNSDLSLGGEQMNRGEIPLHEHGVAEIEIGITEHGDFECTYSFSYGKHSYPYDLEVKSSSADSN